MWLLTIVCNSSRTGSNTLFGLPWVQGINVMQSHTCRQNTHTHFFKKKKLVDSLKLQSVLQHEKRSRKNIQSSHVCAHAHTKLHCGNTWCCQVKKITSRWRGIKLLLLEVRKMVHLSGELAHNFWNSSSWELSVLWGHCTHRVHTHTCKQNTYTQN